MSGAGGSGFTDASRRGYRDIEVTAEMVASVLSVDVAVGERVHAGAALVMLESMKMEIPVLTDISGLVSELNVSPGDLVQEGDVLLTIRP